MLTFRVQSTFFVFICLLATLISCAPPARYTPSFHVIMKSLDVTSLQGRRIVIDPGHGGRFTGAVGVQGLRESDINLTVGLHLWGLLKQAGADAIITRSADIDLCTPGSADLSEDLMARARLSNDFKADLFVSIHHNSNTYDRKKDETEIYYKLMDPGASRDLATCVSQELKKERSLPQVFVFPGNYRVLRNTQAVAILGEASFISNEENEKRLSRANHLTQEAEGYFLGILTYFQKGIPKISDCQPDNVTLHDAFPRLQAKIMGGENGRTIDPKTPHLRLDGEVVSASFDPQTEIISYRPDKPLKNGWHTFAVEARNMNGNASWSSPVCFCISLPPATITVSPAFASLPADGKSSTCIQVEVLDHYDNPVIDNTVIELKAFAGKIDRPMAKTANGRAVAYFVSSKRPKEALIEARSNAISGKTIIECGPVDAALMRIAVYDNNHAPLNKVSVQGKDALLGISNEEGLVFINNPEAGESGIRISKPGYETAERTVVFIKGIAKEETFTLTPREHGLFLGEKFVLDPEPWDENSIADGGEANFLVARKLQALLEEAGALTLLTGNSPAEHLTPEDRVITGEKFAGDYFITIAHRKGMPSTSHYFLSRPGKNLAQAIAGVMKSELQCKDVTAQEGLDFTIIQPSATSLLVNFGENKKIKESPVDLKARCIYQGLIEFLTRRKER